MTFITAFSKIKQLREGCEDEKRGPFHFVVPKEEIEGQQNKNMDIYIIPRIESTTYNGLYTVLLNKNITLTPEQFRNIKQQGVFIDGDVDQSNKVKLPHGTLWGKLFPSYFYNEYDVPSSYKNICLHDNPNFTNVKNIFEKVLQRNIKNITTINDDLRETKIPSEDHDALGKIFPEALIKQIKHSEI